MWQEIPEIEADIESELLGIALLGLEHKDGNNYIFSERETEHAMLLFRKTLKVQTARGLEMKENKRVQPCRV